MPSVTFDGRSFMLDGRRIWIVSGSIDYFRIPRELWADRIHAAKLAGFNTIVASVDWARCEPRASQFDFGGDNDIRHFIHLVGEAGLWCVLRPGPFIGSGVDFGGLPPWLGGVANISFRTANGPFLEACSRYITALAEQVRSQQVTSPGKGGPIILVQNENAWTCGHAALSHGYLGELNRYLREAGFTVPTINANNLWQGVEGEVDCWTGGHRLLSTLRELAVVRPAQPRVVIDVDVAPLASWTTGTPAPPSGPSIARRLAEILAAGGQYNIASLVGGTNFGFMGGRLTDGVESYACSTPHPSAPISETGAPGAMMPYVRRISTFASRFGRVFANLDPLYQPVVLDPGEAGAVKGKGAEPGPAVVHAFGAQGGVVFVFAAPGAAPGGTVTLLLREGTALPTPIGSSGVAWCLLNVAITSRAVVDYCSLSALGTVGNVLVCFGPPGTEGVVSINGSPITLRVPAERTPLVVTQEGITIVVCNEDLVDQTYLAEGAVYVGVTGIRADGTPVASEEAYAKIDADGTVTTTPAAAGRRARSAPRAVIAGWSTATTEDYTSGASARFAAIDGPADLAALGAPHGYGWYRIMLKRTSGKRVKFALPSCLDRFHLFLDGRDSGVIGRGPGAARELSISLRRGDQTMVVLAENLGRVCGGSDLGESKGLIRHAWEVSPLHVGKATVRAGPPIDVLGFKAPLWEVAEGDQTSPDRLTWTFRHTRKVPVFMHIAQPVARGLLLLNDRPVRYLGRSSGGYVCFEADDLSRGMNTVQIALVADGAGLSTDERELEDLASNMSSSVTFWLGTASVTAKAEWAFARWEPPMSSAFSPAGRPGDWQGPTWSRTMFKAADTHAALMLEPIGMTKGQIYLNGRHVCRYFVASAAGEKIGPVARYYLPEPWVHAGGDNELMLFDEHGADPSKCRLVYDASSPPVRA